MNAGDVAVDWVRAGKNLVFQALGRKGYCRAENEKTAGYRDKTIRNRDKSPKSGTRAKNCSKCVVHINKVHVLPARAYRKGVRTMIEFLDDW